MHSEKSTELAEKREEAPGADRPRKHETVRFLAISSYLVLLAAMFLLGFATWLIASKGTQTPPEGDTAALWVLSAHGPTVLMVLAALVVGRWGIRMLVAAGENPAPSPIPEKDRQLLEDSIRGGSRDSVQLYVVLSSLSGFTGTFQKVGFSGLPLATVLLTLIFCALHFVEQLGDGTTNDAFLELAKLTTGAFIGSFVQKGQTATSPAPTDDEVNQAMRALRETSI